MKKKNLTSCSNDTSDGDWTRFPRSSLPLVPPYLYQTCRICRHSLKMIINIYDKKKTHNGLAYGRCCRCQGVVVSPCHIWKVTCRLRHVTFPRTCNKSLSFYFNYARQRGRRVATSTATRGNRLEVENRLEKGLKMCRVSSPWYVFFFFFFLIFLQH